MNGTSCADDLWSEADEQELVSVVSELENPSDQGETKSEFFLECDLLLQPEGTPRERYGGKYLIVSDFVRQHWCEQQLLYSLSPEVYRMRALPGVKADIEETPAAKEVKEKGTDIHQTRELEIQVPVEVTVVTKEDKWAVKFLNLQFSVLAFHKGNRIAREIPVFGVPFNSGLFVFGIIDELQYNPDTYAIKISELKTRRNRHPPKSSQQKKDIYQVGLYAQIFNELVQGKVTKEMLSLHLGLNMDRSLSDGVKQHIKNHGSHKSNDDCTLGKLLDVVLCQIQSLTCITEATVEYVHQDTGEEIISVHSVFDPDMVEQEFFKQCEWWLGERGTKGVDIEDCWKCDYCRFAPLCEWREVMAAKLSRKQKQ